MVVYGGHGGHGQFFPSHIHLICNLLWFLCVFSALNAQFARHWAARIWSDSTLFFRWARQASKFKMFKMHQPFWSDSAFRTCISHRRYAQQDWIWLNSFIELYFCIPPIPWYNANIETFFRLLMYILSLSGYPRQSWLTMRRAWDGSYLGKLWNEEETNCENEETWAGKEVRIVSEALRGWGAKLGKSREKGGKIWEACGSVVAKKLCGKSSGGNIKGPGR